MSGSKQVAVFGGGSWGIALTLVLNANGHDVVIWEFDERDAESLQYTRENPERLPGIRIPDGITVTSDLSEATADAEIVLFVIPSHTIRQTAGNLSKLKRDINLYVNCAKGIENETCLRMSQVITEEIPGADSSNVVTLSGPSHAEEVSRGLPTSVVVACESLDAAQRAQRILNNENFRLYTSSDIVGVELGGSVKNIIAIAAGISVGLGFGDNTAGALMTRGLAEIARLGREFGADPLTFAGLSGIGDLITTCMSKHSRNRYVGECIGKGQTLREVLSQMVMVAEGVNTTRSVHDLAGRLGVEMPITDQVYRILFEEKDPLQAVRELMSRDLRSEN
jgi:glycerol-3-phosphate dehydrogenase (NAD(P)+)